MPITLQPDTVTTDLVSSARAQQNPSLAALASSNAAYLASLISAASGAIRGQCHRDFTVSQYVDYHSGTPDQGCLRLRQFPVVSITRVATATPALTVYSSGVAAQRATVATTATGVTISSVSSGVATNTVLSYATYPTLAALSAAIAGLGAGWSALVLSGSYGSFAAWSSSDLKATQGALTALGGGATLEIYQDFQSGTGCDFAEGNYCPAGWRLDADTGELFAAWPRGVLNLRVDYSAGFDPVPDAVQEACVQLASDLYSQSQISGAVQKASIGSASYTLNTTSKTLAASPKILGLIAPYIAHDKVISR